MFENTVIKEVLPEDVMSSAAFDSVKNQFINTLSENKFSISQTRYLFSSIISQFERHMPVTNHKNE